MGNSTAAPPPPTCSSARAPTPHVLDATRAAESAVARCKRGEEMSGAACLPTLRLMALVVLVAQAAGRGALIDGNYLCNSVGAPGHFMPDNVYKRCSENASTHNSNSTTCNVTCGDQAQIFVDSFTGIRESTIIKFIKSQDFDICATNISLMPGSSPQAETHRLALVEELQKSTFGSTCCMNPALSRCSYSIDLSFHSALCKNSNDYVGTNIVLEETGLTCDQGVHSTLMGISEMNQTSLRQLFDTGELMCSIASVLRGEERRIVEGLVQYMRKVTGPKCCKDKTSICGTDTPATTKTKAPAPLKDNKDAVSAGARYLEHNLIRSALLISVLSATLLLLDGFL